jgi:hypothetical protein
MPVTIPHPAKDPAAPHPRPRRTSEHIVKAKLGVSCTPAKENSGAASNVAPLSKQTAQAVHPSCPTGTSSPAIPLLANTPSPSLGSLPSWSGSSSRGLLTASRGNSKGAQTPPLSQEQYPLRPDLPPPRHQPGAYLALSPGNAQAESVVRTLKDRGPSAAQLAPDVRLPDTQTPAVGAPCIRRTPGRAVHTRNEGQREQITRTVFSQAVEPLPKNTSNPLGPPVVTSGDMDSKMLWQRAPRPGQGEGRSAALTAVSGVPESAKAQHNTDGDISHPRRAALAPSLANPTESLTAANMQDAPRRSGGFTETGMLPGRAKQRAPGRVRSGNSWLDTAEGFMSGLEAQWAALRAPVMVCPNSHPQPRQCCEIVLMAL